MPNEVQVVAERIRLPIRFEFRRVRVGLYAAKYDKRDFQGT